jgi:uncharacterized membrane protein YfcA
MSGSHALIAVLGTMNLVYIVAWMLIERGRPRTPGQRFWLQDLSTRSGWLDLATGLVINFLDTLGIGSFAPATATFKLRRNVADENIPGTLNAGLAVPTALEGLIYITLVSVDPTTLVGMIAASVAGAWLGAGVVARFSRRAVQVTMGFALLAGAAIFAATAAHWLPGGGEATGLSGSLLVLACTVNFILGALMSAGVGLYAPCLILVSLLGMSPIAAFPIMSGSCACLMPVAGMQLIRRGRYDRRAAAALTLGGIPGVLLAAYVVKHLDMNVLRWLVGGVVLHAAIAMLRSALAGGAAQPAQTVPAGPGA